MEWREQSSLSCQEAYLEAQRWIEAVTKKKFGSSNFRSELENGVLLCDLINKIKPGTIRRVNRLPTPIAGLDNLNVFLKACGRLGLKEAQLFHPGDLQDLSTRVTVKDEETNRRLKNVLITIFWLGRRAQSDRFYDGPHLNFKAFEGLLGTALYKTLQETSSQRGSSVRDSGFGESWYTEREELNHLKEGGGGGGGGHRREDSLDSLDSLGSQSHSVSSENTLKGSSEGCGSDTEADSGIRMAENKDSAAYRRSLVLTPKTTAQFNQFLPTKDKPSAYVPAPLRKKRAERNEDNRRSWTSSASIEDEGPITSETKLSSEHGGRSQSALPTTHLQWAYEYESGSDSDADRPDPDLVLDDLASRRFQSPASTTPTNFAVPISPSAGVRVAGGRGGGPWPKVSMTPNVAPPQNVTCLSTGTNRLETQPPRHGLVRVDHRRIVSHDSLFRDLYDDSEDEDDEVGYADPIQDDVYARKVGIKPQSPSKASYDKFLPKFWTPEEDVHIQKIKLGSQRRPWYRKMQGFSYKKSGSSSDDSDCDVSPWLSSAPSSSGPSPSHSHTPKTSAHTTLVVGKRQVQQMEESIDGSKSTSDIYGDPAVSRQIRFEELQKFREQVKESDDKWQDDLSKWKNRRRSVNSDIVKKKEEREKIEQTTFGSNRRSKTFREMQEERENKGSRLSSLSYLSNEDDVFDAPVISPRSRTLPARSYTIDTPYYSSSEPSVAPLKEAEPPAASSIITRAASRPSASEDDTVDSSASKYSSVTTTSSSSSSILTPNSLSSANHSPSPPPPSQRSPVFQRSSPVKTEEPARVFSSSSSSSSARTVPEPRRPLSGVQTQVEPPSSVSLYKPQAPLSSMEPNPPAVARVSASLPRSYQRSDSSRLTSVVTPRPFGTQSTRITSLPRVVPADDSHKRVNGGVNVSKKSSVPSRYHQFMTPEDEAQSSSADSSEEEEEEEEKVTTTKSVSSVTSTQSVSPVPPPVKSEAPVSPAKETSQENCCEMRISLNQKPNSSRDFGFQAAWDSTGARVTSIQPGSPAQMCQLQAGDEVLTVNLHKVAEMSYTEWKSHMEEALQEGMLVMDIRRHGQNNWDRDQPSLPYKSHKTLNLTSMDHPILPGSSEANPVSPSLDFTSRLSSEASPSKDPFPRQVIDVASNGVNGGFREESVTMRNKESEPISLKNLKRRSEFFGQGGPENVMADIPVPSLTTSSSRWSWDPEEERRRQEKWQKEQDRLLQEKYKRDQEKLQEEWLKAQQDISTNAGREQPGSLEVNSFTSQRSAVSPLSQPSSLLWGEEEEERKRKEEQERQRQEEERRKRAEEERELLRLQEERKRREWQEEEERERRKEEQERQRQAEERRKREEEEEQLQRLQEERKRREWQEEEERKAREAEQLRWQREREAEEKERRRQEFEEQDRRERERAEEVQRRQQWAAGSHGFVHSSLSFTDRTKSKSSPQLDEVDKPQSKGVSVQPGGLAHWLLKDQLRSARDRQAQSERTASELELERRDILNAMRFREPERVAGSGFGERRGQQLLSQAEADRQQILREMKKKTPLLTDSSWIRQRSSSSSITKDSDLPSMRRGESLDNLDSSRYSWRSSWTPRSNSYSQNSSRPHSALSGSTSSSFYGGGSGVQRPASSTLPSSYSMGSLRGGAGTPSSPWSRQSLSPSPSSPSPTTSPEPTLERGGAPPQRSRSVSGKKICTFCENPLGKGAAMIIESLGLCYHMSCFKCFDCQSGLGGSEAGAEVRIRNKQLYCNNCYMRFKSGQPTAM